MLTLSDVLSPPVLPWYSLWIIPFLIVKSPAESSASTINSLVPTESASNSFTSFNLEIISESVRDCV